MVVGWLDSRRSIVGRGPGHRGLVNHSSFWVTDEEYNGTTGRGLVNKTLFDRGRLRPLPRGTVPVQQDNDILTLWDS